MARTKSRLSLGNRTPKKKRHSYVVDELKYEEEENERIDFTMNNLTDIEITLKNKVFRFFKSLLMFSNVTGRLENMKTYEALKNETLDVEEKVVFNLIVGQQMQGIPENFIDYFLFFLHFGMKKEMRRVVILWVQNASDFVQVFEDFKKCCFCLENDNIKSWFSDSPVWDDEVCVHSFTSSLSYVVFAKLSQLSLGLIDKKRKLNLLKIKYINNVKYHLIVFANRSINNDENNVFQISDHKDFNNFDMELTSFKHHNTRILNGELSNVRLVSTEGSTFNATIEHLSYRTNFFHRMFRFRGLEVKEMEETGMIRIIDMNSPVLKEFLHYVYFNEIRTGNLEIILNLISIANKFFELRFIKLLLDRLYTITPSSYTRTQVENILLRKGHLIYGIELFSHILPRLKLLMRITTSLQGGKNAIMKIVRKSYKNWLNENAIEEFREQVNSLRKENKDFFKRQTKVNEELKEENKMLGKENEQLKCELAKALQRLDCLEREYNLQVLSGGRKRKRGEGQSEDEEEGESKKRRKIQ